MCCSSISILYVREQKPTQAERLRNLPPAAQLSTPGGMILCPSFEGEADPTLCLLLDFRRAHDRVERPG